MARNIMRAALANDAKVIQTSTSEVMVLHKLFLLTKNIHWLANHHIQHQK